MDLLKIKQRLHTLLSGMHVPGSGRYHKRVLMDELLYADSGIEIADKLLPELQWACQWLGDSVKGLILIMRHIVTPSEWATRGVLFNPEIIPEDSAYYTYVFYDIPECQTTQQVKKNVFYYGGVDLTVKQGRAIVCSKSKVLVENDADVGVGDCTSVVARDKAYVCAHDYSVVELHDESTAEAFGHAQVFANEHSRVFGKKRSILYLSGQASARIYDSCRTVAEGSSVVTAFGKSQVGFALYETGEKPQIIQKNNAVELIGFNTPDELEAYKFALTQED